MVFWHLWVVNVHLLRLQPLNLCSESWLGMSQIGCPGFLLFSGHARDFYGTWIRTPGACPQKGVYWRTKMRTRDTKIRAFGTQKDILTYLSPCMGKYGVYVWGRLMSLKQPSQNIHTPHHQRIKQPWPIRWPQGNHCQRQRQHCCNCRCPWCKTPCSRGVGAAVLAL